VTNNIFHFLDVKLLINENGKIDTTVYVKPTDKGLYTNFHSHIPQQYKKSVIKTLVTRALKYSSTWANYHREINRIKQILVNNNYPLFMIDNVVNRALDQFFKISDSTLTNKIEYYFRLNNVKHFVKDSDKIKSIITSHVQPTDPSTTVAVVPYYKPRKLSSFFSTRPSIENRNRANVVYKFDCSEAGCNATYVGYTTNTLLKRCKQHRYSSSSINSHYSYDHHMNVPPFDTLINNFSILYSSYCKIDLKIAEAIEIKKNNPYINVKYNESYSLLKIFS
jgi:hypothetical protein